MPDAGKRSRLSVSIAAVAFALLAALATGCAPTSERGLIADDAAHESAAQRVARISQLNAKGRFAQAAEEARELTSILQAFRSTHPQDLALSTTMLGGLLVSQGSPALAAPLLEQALAIHRTAGRDPRNLAATLALLGKAQLKLGDLSRAAALTREALGLRTALGSGERFALATTHITLGDIALASQQYDEAERQYLEGVEIRRSLGEPHAISEVLLRLGELYFQQQNLDAAERLTTTGLELAQRHIDPNHIHLARARILLGRIHTAGGRYATGYRLLLDGVAIESQVLRNMAGFTTQEQQLAFLAEGSANLDILLTLTARHFRSDPEAIRRAYDALLVRKGAVLDVQSRFHQALLENSTEALTLFEELSEVRSRLSGLSLADTSPAPKSSTKGTTAGLLRQKQRLELRIGKLSRRYYDYLEILKTDTDRVAGALPPSSMLVDFVRVRQYDFRAGPTAARWLGSKYFAFVLRGAAGPRVELVEVGDADRIDSVITEVRDSLAAGAGAALSRRSFNAYVKLASAAYETLLGPIERSGPLPEAFFLAPDSAIYLVPFEVLIKPSSRFVIEDHTITYLTSGRDLAFRDSSPAQGTTPPAVFGNPAFGVYSAGEAARAGSSSLMTDGFPVKFDDLPGAQEEALEIGRILAADGGRTFVGAQADDAALRALRNPRYLHLATHGFLASDLDPNAQTGASTAVGRIDISRLRNPLLRAGIALSGANALPRSKERSKGIFTAEEVLDLRLVGTQLVTLSACETGLGVLHAGEGVFGLRRAFAQAGAKNVVMSMWPVSDLDTKELMVEFYSRLVAEDRTVSSALRTAALTQMGRVRERHGVAHPVLWGPFIVSAAH